jgi:uncharacterized membrane protein YkoI
MLKTTDKIIFGILAILFIGMSGVFITAMSSGETLSNSVSNNRELVISEVTLPIAELVGEDDDELDEEVEVAITGTALEQASAVALAHMGEGRVTDTEVGDEEGFYEIEVTLNNGNEVDVHLDENFNVLSVEH